MLKFVQADGTDPFILFSLTHLLTLGVVVLFILSIYLFRKQLRTPKVDFYVRWTFVVVLVVSEISLHAWLWWTNAWDLRHSLPFHLSSISLILSSLLLMTKSYSIFEFTYFAGMGSAIQAMITPDISAFTSPHFRYVHFFISHGGIVVANMYMVLVAAFRPSFKSLWKAFLYLNLYTGFILLFNYFIEGNYMYISRKPVNPSILDYLAPWPWYILQLEAIAVATFLLLYMPFWVYRRHQRKKNRLVQ